MNKLFNFSIVVFISLLYVPLNYLSAQEFNQEYLTTLDSVKNIYGDTCSIGVSSRLIDRLNQYKKNPIVKKYLDDYYKIKNLIENFRKAYHTTLEKDNVILLSLPRIFKQKTEWNVVNAAGIYFGADSVTNIASAAETFQIAGRKFHFGPDFLTINHSFAKIFSFF